MLYNYKETIMDIYIVISKKGKVICHLFDSELTKSKLRELTNQHLIIKRKGKQ